MESVRNISFIQSYLEDFIISVIPCFALKFCHKLNPASFFGLSLHAYSNEFGYYEGVQTEEYCEIHPFHN